MRRLVLICVGALMLTIGGAGIARATAPSAHVRHGAAASIRDRADAARAIDARRGAARSVRGAAASCTTAWASAVSGSWNTASDWTNGVPTSTCAATIAVAGTYTVTISGVNDPAASLALGATSGKQTVAIDATDNCNGASNAELALGAGGTVGAHGMIELSQTTTSNCGEGTPLLEVSGGTLTNSGTIESDLGPDQTNGAYPAYLDGAIVNSGAMNINDDAYLGEDISASSLDDKGALTFTKNSTLTGEQSATVTDDTAGSIINAGASTGGLVMNGGTYTQGNGTMSPTTLNPTNPAVLLDSANLAYTGTGASSVVFRGTGALSGNLAAGQNLTIQATDFCNGAINGVATAAASFTNAGDIDLTQTTNSGDCGEGLPALEVSTGATLTNSGTIQTNLGPTQTNGGYPAYLDGALINTGAITINENSYLGEDISNSSLDNKGTLTLATGSTLTGEQSATVTDDTAGLITNTTGTGQLIMNGGTYTQGNGTMSPTTLNPTNPAVLLDSANLAYTGTGASSVVFRGTGALSGNLAAGQNLTIQATDFCNGAINGVATAAASFTNAGDIDLTQTTNSGDCGEGLPALEVSTGATLTNSGTIQTNLGPTQTNGGYPAYLDGALINTGAITINENSYLGEDISNSSLDNKGTLTLATGSTLTGEQSATVTDDTAGLITNTTGTGQLIMNGGTYTQGAGKINQTAPVPANPAVLLLQSPALKYTGKGTGTIVSEGSTAETGSLAKGQNLDLASTDTCNGATNSELSPTKSLTNAATISFSHVGSCGEGTAYISLASGLKLTNTGTLSGVAGAQQIDGTLTNTGTVSVAAGITLTLDGTLTNMSTSTGTLKGGIYTLSGTFEYENASFATNGITDNDAALTLNGSGGFTDGNGANALRNLATNAKTLKLTGADGLTTSASLTDTGTIALGGGSTLTVDGGYTQSSKGVLAITLASASSYGELVASGPSVQSSLAGTLDLDQTYPASASTSETVLSASDLTGTFAKVVVKNTGGKGSATPTASYTATGVTVTG